MGKADTSPHSGRVGLHRVVNDGWPGLGSAQLGLGYPGQVDPDTEPTATTNEEEKKDEHQGMATNTNHHHPGLCSFLSVFVSSVLKAPSAAYSAEQHLRG